MTKAKGPFAVKHGNRQHIANTERAISRREDFKAGNLSGVSGNFSTSRYTGLLNEQEEINWKYDAPEISYVVYSYQTPIAWFSNVHGWHVVDQKFSVSTSWQQSRVRSALAPRGAVA